MNQETILLDKKKKSEPFVPRQKAPKKKRGLFVGFLLVAIVAVSAVLFFRLGLGKEEAASGSTYSVTRDDLLISVIESGSLKAKRSVEIKSRVEGSATIISIVPEGTFVKEGDNLVTLDSADLTERCTQQEISYESAKASWVQAQESKKIQESQNKSDINAGKLDVEFAVKNQNKYIEGDWPQQLRNLTSAITIADEQKKRAKEKVKWTEELAKKGFVGSEELEGDRLALKQREIDLEKSQEQKRLAIEYDNPMELRTLETNLEEAKQELTRTEARAASQMAQEEANLKSKQAQYLLQKERFEKLKEQIANSAIKAPQDGLVVYGSGSSGGGRRMGRSENDMIEEGVTVRNRQTIITLPDVSLMEVETKVHESSRALVETGQEALVTVDAFPDLRFHGKVTKVAILADSQSRWLNPDLKIYRTNITLDDGNDKLKPGMSAKVEIIINRLKDVIYVPIQSVYRRGGSEVCYVSDGGAIEVRPVIAGLHNDSFVEIKKGLEEGEQVLLYQPAIGESTDEEEEEEKKKGEEMDKGKEGDEGMDEGRERGGRRGERGDRQPGSFEGMGRRGERGDRQPGSSGGRGRRGGMGNMPFSSEMMDKARNMSFEERTEYFKKLQEEGKLGSSPFNRGGDRGGSEGMGSRGGRRGSRRGEGRRPSRGERGERGESEEGGTEDLKGKDVFTPMKKGEGEKGKTPEKGSEKE